MPRKFCALFAFACTALYGGPLDNWHTRTNLGDSAISGVAYHDGTYVLTGLAPAQIITLTNLASPATATTNSISKMPRAVAYGAGRFVVVGDNIALSSTNGYDWNTHSVTGNFGSLVFTSNRFVAVGSRVSIASTNGTDWVHGVIPLGVSEDLIYGNGIFLASGSSSNAISTDGISWEPILFLASSGSYTIGYGEAKFVCISISSDVMTSVDGRSWTTHGKINVTRPNRIAYGNGFFVTAGGGSLAYSDDGITWTILPSAFTGAQVAFIDGRFIATGYRSVRESDPVVQLLLSEGGINIQFAPGRRVQMETTDDLLEGIWEQAGPPLTLDSDGTALFALPAGAANRFFRAAVTAPN